MLLELSHWFRETSLRDGAVLVFRQLLWGCDLSKVDGVLFEDRLLVLTGTGGLPKVDAFVTALPETPGERGGLLSSDGADNGREVRGRLGLMYADTTEMSTPRPESTLFSVSTLSPVSTSVSSAPISASRFSRKGGIREELRVREQLL